MHIMWVVLGIALMLVLNMKFKVNAMVSLLIACLLYTSPSPRD